MTIHPRRVQSEIALLECTFEPGEHLVAETFGSAGRVPWWEGSAMYGAYALAAFGALAAAVTFVLGKHGQAGLIWLCAAPSQLAWYAAAHRKPACIVVSNDFVYLLRLPRGRFGRARFMRSPIGCVLVAADNATRFRRVIRLEGPDLPMQGLQFLVTGQWRHDLDNLIEALRASSDGRGPALVA